MQCGGDRLGLRSLETSAARARRLRSACRLFSSSLSTLSRPVSPIASVTAAVGHHGVLLVVHGRYPNICPRIET